MDCHTRNENLLSLSLSLSLFSSLSLSLILRNFIRSHEFCISILTRGWTLFQNCLFLSFVLFGVFFFFTKTKTESVREELRYQKYSKRETRDILRALWRCGATR